MRGGARAAVHRPRGRRASASEADELRARYELRSHELRIDERTPTAGALAAYLTEEVREGRPRPTRACIMLPGACGWRHPPTRRLADRIAIFCSCIVLVPDLLRTGDPWPSQKPQCGEAFTSWVSAQPPQRIASDVRTSTIYLRADHRVESVALFGAGIGGDQVLDQLQAPSMYAAAAAVCPTKLPTFTPAYVPLLTLFDCDNENEERAAAAMRSLETHLLKQAAQGDNTVLDLDDLENESSRAGKDEQGLDGRTPNTMMRGPSLTALRRMKVAELRERLKELQLHNNGLKAELVTRLYQALQPTQLGDASNSRAAWPSSASPALKVSATQRAPRLDKMKKHLVLQFAGVMEFCDGTSQRPAKATTKAETVGGTGVDTPMGQEPSGDEDDGTEEFQDGDFGKDNKIVTNEAEDAMVMVEAWLNFHFDHHDG